MRFNLSHRPEGAVWWGIALWDNGPTSDKKSFNEINFGYTTNQYLSNTQLLFESAKLGKALSLPIDTGVELYDGQYHEASLEYDADHHGQDLHSNRPDGFHHRPASRQLAPYDWYLDTAALANGVYTLRATATSTAAAGGDVNTVSLPITLQN